MRSYKTIDKSRRDKTDQIKEKEQKAEALLKKTQHRKRQDDDVNPSNQKKLSTELN